MKKSTIIGLFVFWVTVASALTAGLVFSEKKASTKSDKAVLGMIKKENSSDQDIKLTASEVAKHSSASDCWMIVSGKVYNVTSYAGSHPGGVGTIYSYCGKDGTSVFYGLPHSQNAANILASYYIGDLGSATTQSPSGSFTAQTGGHVPAGSTVASQPSVQRGTTSQQREDDD